MCIFVQMPRRNFVLSSFFMIPCCAQYLCCTHRWRRTQYLSPGLCELQLLRLSLAVLTLRRSLPLSTNEDGRL